jgi:RNA polymerase sigma factor (sigma-70 family)
MDDLGVHLARHDFKALFVEALGWDHASAEHRLDADGLTFTFRLIAHKRGFQILVCEADRYTLFNRHRLRELERQVARLAHEHVIIYTCSEPRKQVWQWAVHMPDGRKLRHREHPFFTEMPPQALLTRIRGLRFSLDEEEQITLADALDRARNALDTKSEHNLFVNHPKYAEQGDKLAMAMANGGVEAFHRFVLFHRRLARWGVKRLVRHFDIDEEDAEQFGMLGLLAAAKHFKHEKGFQFSTYATTAIHQRCQRHGPEQAMLIRVPSLAYWPLHRYLRTAQKLDARSGTWVGEQFVEWITRRTPLVGLRIRQFRQAVGIRSLSDPAEPECLLARKLPSDERLPDAGMMLLDTQSVVRQCVDQLEERDAEILRRRYGFNSTPETLESIARSVDLTKERVRQIILKAEAALRPLLGPKLGVDASTKVDAPETGVTPAANPNELSLDDAVTGEVLAAIQRARDIGSVELASILRMDRWKRKAALRALVTSGQIEQVGTGRMARYRPKQVSVEPPPAQESPTVFVLLSEHARMQGELFAHAN